MKDRQKAIEDATKLLMENAMTAEDFLSRVSYSSGTKDLCDDYDIAGVDEHLEIDVAEEENGLNEP